MILRRRSDLMAQRARTNQGFVASNEQMSRQHMSASTAVWTTANPPPAYDNIYDQSFPVNPLPDYSTTQKIHLNEQIMLKQLVPDTPHDPRRNSNTTQQQQQVLFNENDQLVTIVNPAFNANDVIADNNNNLTSTNDITLDHIKPGSVTTVNDDKTC